MMTDKLFDVGGGVEDGKRYDSERFVEFDTHGELRALQPPRFR